jgi:hypothetical protein
MDKEDRILDKYWLVNIWLLQVPFFGKDLNRGNLIIMLVETALFQKFSYFFSWVLERFATFAWVTYFYF